MRTHQFAVWVFVLAMFWALPAVSAPKFLETGKVYRFMPDDNSEPKSMLVVETDPDSDWIRVKPVDQATDRSIWINLDSMGAIQPIQ